MGRVCSFLLRCLLMCHKIVDNPSIPKKKELREFAGYSIFQDRTVDL